jgi:hypothetical protein
MQTWKKCMVIGPLGIGLWRNSQRAKVETRVAENFFKYYFYNIIIVLVIFQFAVVLSAKHDKKRKFLK